jgi:hypothetical protein
LILNNKFEEKRAMTVKFRDLLLFASLVSFLLPAVDAQTAARILGTVRDQDGQPINQASIEAVGQKSAEKRKLHTEKDGSFSLAELPPDVYQISASCDTCSDLSKIVEVGAGQTRSVELALDTKSSSSVIAVDDRAASLDASSAKIGMNVAATEIATLPVNGRSFALLALTAPFITNSGGGGVQDLRFVGQSVEQNRYLLDGVDTSSVISAGPGYIPIAGYEFRLRNSLDTVDEFRVDTAGYSAEDGGVSGGQIKLVSKAGSNGWHGSLFEYFRNDKLQARNYFDGSEKSQLRMNQFGANAGGAFIKDKLFAFASFEDLRQQAGLNVLENVPSVAARSRAVPEVLDILAAMPVGTQSTLDPDVSRATRHANARQNESNYSGRLDYLLSTKHRLFIRYSRSAGDLSVPDQTTTDRDISARTRPDQTVASWSYEVNQNLINQITLGLNRAPISVGATSGSAQLDDSRVFIGNTATGGFASPGDLIQLSTGLYGDAAIFHGRSYNAGDKMSWLKGHHSIQIGAEMRVLRIPFSTEGGLTYSLRNLDTLLTNEDADVSSIGDVSQSVAEQEQYSGYIQDQWHITPQIQAVFGLRYDYFGATRERNNHASLFDYTTFTSTAANGGFYPASKLGFEPRFGLTWSPKRQKGDTVLRMGAGIYNGPTSPMDALWPIENTAPSKLVRGVSFPQTETQVLNSTNSIASPRALDLSSFGAPQRNYLFTASLQQALSHQFLGQIGYTGSLSRHLTQESFANLSLAVDPATGNTIRANGAYSAIPFLTNGGNSYYNALQLSVNRHLVDNLTATASYNLSHSIGDAQGSGEYQPAQDPLCLACERGDNSFDTRQSFALNTIYALPFGKEQRHFSRGWASSLLGGWTMAAAWNYHSGLPLNVVADRSNEIYYSNQTQQYYSPSSVLPSDAVAVTNGPYGLESAGVLRPNVVAGVNPYLSKQNSPGFLNPAAFATPLPGTFGNLGRNALRGPGFSQLDFQVSRRFVFAARYNFELRGEVFNLLNHTNFSNPSVVLADSTVDGQPGTAYTHALAPGFGLLNSTVGRTVGLGTSRQFQLSARFQF